MPFVSNISFNLIALLEYVTVLLEYIDALSMQHGICIGDLAPASLPPPPPHPVSPTSNNTPYNIIVCALGDILSMIIIIITNRALLIKLYQ